MAVVGRLILMVLSGILGGLVVDIRKTEREIKELEKENEKLEEMLKSLEI